MARGKRAKIKSKLSYDDAVAKLSALHNRILALDAEYRALSRDVAKQVAKLREPVDRMGMSLKGLRLAERSLQRVVDRGQVRVSPIREVVDNPHRSDDLVADQLQAGEGEAGLIEVDVQLSTRIGGLARLSGHLDEFQMVAAGKFRSDWDQAQIGGARAIDYSMPRVDTSGSGQADVVNFAGDALTAYSRAVKSLGMIKANLVQSVICEDMSLRQLARKLGRPEGGKATEKLRDEVLEAVNGLVRVYGTKAEGRRQDLRSDAGDRLPLPAGKLEVVYSGEEGHGVNNKAA